MIRHFRRPFVGAVSSNLSFHIRFFSTPSVIPTATPIPTQAGLRVGGATFSHSTSSLIEAHTRFLNIYGGGADTPTEAWMASYYRRPSPEYLPAALLEAMYHPEPWIGVRALPMATFIGGVIRIMVPTKASGEALLATIFTAAAITTIGSGASGPLKARAAFTLLHAVPHGGEILDTLLRAFWLANVSHLDELLAGAAKDAAQSVAVAMSKGTFSSNADMSTTTSPSASDLTALAFSLFPPPGERNRASSILAWPFPAADIAAFTAHVKRAKYAIWGSSRYIFSITHALHVKTSLSSSSSSSSPSSSPLPSLVNILAPGAAREINNNMITALWSYFYATGESRQVVSRVLDAAADYADYLDEFGSSPVTRVLEERNTTTRTKTNNTEWQTDTNCDPPELEDSPHDAMRFGASRFALVSLLWHARRHTAVADAFAVDLAAAQDAAASEDPLGLGPNEPGGGGGGGGGGVVLWLVF